MTPGQDDLWASGEAYEAYVGRWSRLVAREFLAWLDLAPGLRWLDVGAGAGALSQTILATMAPREVVGVDRSEDYVAYARDRLTDPRARFRVADAQSLPFANPEFDAVVSGLVLNFVPAQARAVAEMRRAVRADGTVGVYVWDYAGEMQLMRHFWNAAVAFDPAANDFDEGPRFPICKPEPLAALFSQVGLRDVETRAIDVPTVFRDFDDYWRPFLGGQGPAPGYCVSLPEDRRAALREKIRSSLPTREDGSIHLIARAWAVKARVP
jgi:SAM-dependent methyltransferase